MFYREVFDGLLDAVFLADPKTGIIEEANKQAEILLGRSREELIGMDQSQLHPPEKSAEYKEVFSRHSEVCGDIEAEVIRRDGRIIPVIINATVIQVDGRSQLLGVFRDISEKRQMEEDSLDKLKMLESLYSGAKRVSQQLDTEDLSETIVRDLVEKFGVTLAGIYFREENGEVCLHTSYPAQCEYPHQIRVRWDDSPLAEGPIGRCLQSGNPFLVENIESESSFKRYRDIALAQGFRTSIAFPLGKKDKPFAAFSLYSDQNGFFTPERVEFFHSYASLAAVAFENARLFSEKENHLRKLTALRDIDMAITGSLDLRVTLNVILDNVTRLLEVDAASVLLLNSHSHTLEFGAQRGFHTQTLLHTRLKLGEGHAGRAALERQMVTVPDLLEEQDSFCRSFLTQVERFQSYYGVPLIAKGQVVGVLEIFHREFLKPQNGWEKFLEALAGQAAIAIENASLFHDMEKANTDLFLSYEETIEGWARALDYRDRETEGHSRRVTEMTVRLSKAMGVCDSDLVHVRRGALLHDIGKLGVPDSVLLKAGKLDEIEWEIMKKHPDFSLRLLSPISYLRPAITIPYCHHEKWDGSGYPRGLKGGEIPLEARIFTLVDVWDALTSDRPYRKAWDREEASRYIREQSGSHFDPKVVDAFFKVFKTLE